MKSFILASLLTVVLSGFGVCQTKSILDWYPIADSMANFPPINQELSLAWKKIDRSYVTLIGIKGQPKVLVAAITTSPMTDVKALSLTVAFDGIAPKVGSISTWGYVFDRNHDGKIDYMAMLGGAAADEGEDFPSDFPEGKRPMNKAELSYFIGHCKLIFDHWADDNYDGKFDALVQNDLDPKRDLVARQILVRSTLFTKAFDDVWAFKTDIHGNRDSVEHSDKRVQCRSIGKGNDVITQKVFNARTEILDLVNRAAKAMHLTEENFYHPEEQED